MHQPSDLPRLPPRNADSHKRDYGRILLAGGSPGMCGAISLAGRAALRSGAGLVTIATPDRCCDVVAGYDPCYMTLPLDSDHDGRLAGEALTQILSQPADVVASGPGLGRGDDVVGLANSLFVEVARPMVVDADALYALAVGGIPLGDVAAPRVLTPHVGEFCRLLGQSDWDANACRARAADWAHQHGVVLVLKGHRTIVTDGHRRVENPTGNPGMATGGCGDVLTGIIAALIGQRLAPFEAAQLGVFVHGRAADLAAEQLGYVSLTARDLISYLPDAFRSLDNASARTKSEKRDAR